MRTIQNVKKAQKVKKAGRRDVLKVLSLGVGLGVAAAASMGGQPALAQAESNDEKRKARYQPNSADVQNYYRVNRYPKN